MKLKKLLAMLLALALAMTCLVSCSKDSGEEKTEPEKEVVTEETGEKEEKTQEEAKEEADSKGIEEPIENIVKFYETADAQYILDAFPDVLVDKLTDAEKEEVLSMGDEYATMLEQIDNVAVDYKIADKTALTTEELEEFQKSVTEMLDGEEVEVTAGYLCTVEITLSGEVNGETSSETQDMELNVYEINGEWAIDPSSL